MKQLEELKRLIEERGTDTISLPVNVEELSFILRPGELRIEAKMRGEETERSVTIKADRVEVLINERVRKRTIVLADIASKGGMVLWAWFSYSVYEPRQLSVEVEHDVPVVKVMR